MGRRRRPSVGQALAELPLKRTGPPAAAFRLDQQDRSCCVYALQQQPCPAPNMARRYMREQRVPREVRRRVKRYYSEVWLEQQVGCCWGQRGSVFCGGLCHATQQYPKVAAAGGWWVLAPLLRCRPAIHTIDPAALPLHTIRATRWLPSLPAPPPAGRAGCARLLRRAATHAAHG